MVSIPMVDGLHDLFAALGVEVLGHLDHFSFDGLVAGLPLAGQRALEVVAGIRKGCVDPEVWSAC